MPVFVINAQEPQPQVRTSIERLYAGNFYHWSDRVSFVIAPGPAQMVAESLGVKTRLPDGRTSEGVPDTIVTQLAPSYWGWTGAEFWTWLAAAFQKDQS